jgi:hypothetical protein
MQLPFDFHALEEDLPKIVATSVLIPIRQWVVAQSWNYRRRARISALRKDISELNDFISKQKPHAGEPGVDQSIHIAEEERSRIVQKLNNSFRPEYTEHRTLGAILLIDKPRSFQAFVARVVAYIMLVVVLKEIYDHYYKRHFHIQDIFVVFLIFLGFHYVARRANTITGERNHRRWWQALTLIYRNPLRMGATLQALFLLLAVPIIINALVTMYKGYGFGSLDDNEGTFTFIMLAFYFWLMARHFDRRPANTAAGNPQVTPSTNEFASIPERISKEQKNPNNNQEAFD